MWQLRQKILINNYRIGQKIIIRDSGRFLAAMSELVRFLLLLGLFTVKPTTATIEIQF